MEDFDFNGNSLHHINLEHDEIPPNTIEGKKDLADYIKKLVKGITGTKSTREFKFRSDTTEVHTAVNNIISGGDFVANTQTIADRLLSQERQTQKRMGHLQDVLKGSLLQSYITTEENDYFIITKVDHNAFIDEVSLKKRVGLPFEKKVLKSCLIEIDGTDIVKVLAYDTQSKMSIYWWHDFLELEEFSTNEANTSKAFSSVEKCLNRNVQRKKYPADHLFLKNALFGYFRTHEDFDFDEMIDYIIGAFKPDDSKLDIEKLKDKLEALPKKDNFDRKFTIAADAVPAAKTKQVIHLHENIDLNLKTGVKDLEKIIEPIEGDDGTKYLKIQSEQGYHHFKRGLSLDESD